MSKKEHGGGHSFLSGTLAECINTLVSRNLVRVTRAPGKQVEPESVEPSARAFYRYAGPDRVPKKPEPKAVKGDIISVVFTREGAEIIERLTKDDGHDPLTIGRISQVVEGRSHIHGSKFTRTISFDELAEHIDTDSQQTSQEVLTRLLVGVKELPNRTNFASRHHGTHDDGRGTRTRRGG